MPGTAKREKHPVETLPCNPPLSGQYSVTLNIRYSEETGQKLALILPWNPAPPTEKGFPLVVFVQGSGWKHPNIGSELPQLCDLARLGYAVATIEHRSALDGTPFPGYLTDTKTAIRFLRAKKDKYRIDPERVCIFGTSSGGNTALLVGVTGDDPRFRTAEYADQSDAVRAVIDCFGPTRVSDFVDPARTDGGGWDTIRGLTGDRPVAETCRLMDPRHYLTDGAACPAFFLLHGDADPVVPFAHSEIMYDALLEKGIDARLLRVTGAPHEGSFWSEALWQRIRDFLREAL